jgi:hypothetical protein
MAPKVWNDFVSLVCTHPVISAVILIFFTPPFFPIVKFFSPLLISTAIFMLALFTMGPKKNSSSQEEDEDWTLRRDGDGEKVAKRMKPDGSWKDWVKSIEESSLSWMSSPRSSSKLPKNWKNDETVSILEEASWVKGAEYTPNEFHGSGETSAEFLPNLMKPSELFKVDSGLRSAVERSTYSDMELGEDTPELEHVMEPVVEPVGEPEGPATEISGASVEPTPTVPSHVVLHQPMDTLQMPERADSNVIDSPSTDLDDDSPAIDNSKRLLFAKLKKDSFNANSGLSDVDTPEAGNLSLSGKLKQMEKLGELFDGPELFDKTGHKIPEDSLLKPTTAEQVEEIKDQLDSFVAEKDTASSQTEKNSVVAPSHAELDKEAEKTGPVKNTTDNGKGLSESDSDIEILPSADPAKTKLHPPVKLDDEHLERKLGTSLSQPKGEISEVTQ